MNIRVPVSFFVLTFAFSGPAVANEYATAAELKLMEGFPPPADRIVSKSNALMTPPYNRWSYLNMRMFYPTADIPEADKPIDLERAIDSEIDGLKVTLPDPVGKPAGESAGDYIPTDRTVDMETYLRETFTDALVVVKDGKVIYEKYLNGMTSDHPHQMMSVTKSFAGLFGLIAVSDGKVSEEDPVVKLVPELESSGAFKDATFGQVLDMTNALDFSEDYADPESGIVHYAVVLGLMDPVQGKTYADSIYGYLPTLPRDEAHDHGEVFHYQTPKTDVVNWVANRATGASFQDNLYNVLWSKLGTEGETYVLLDKNATLFAGGGLNASPNNLARFAAMMLNDGKFNGVQVVDPSVIQKLADGGSNKAFADGPNATGIMKNGDWSYRAQWWVRHTPGHEAFSAIGIHGQWIYIDPTRGVAIVKQSSQPTSSKDYQTAYDILGFDAIIAHLSK